MNLKSVHQRSEKRRNTKRIKTQTETQSEAQKNIEIIN